MAIASFIGDQILNKLTRDEDFRIPLGCWISLHSFDPGATGAHEVQGGSYVRKSARFAPARGAVVKNSDAVEFRNLPEIGSLSYIGLWDAQQGGHFLWGLELSTARRTSAGDGFVIGAGDLILTIE